MHNVWKIRWANCMNVSTVNMIWNCPVENLFEMAG
jgi:hypothetical protein